MPLYQPTINDGTLLPANVLVAGATLSSSVVLDGFALGVPVLTLGGTQHDVTLEIIAGDTIQFPVLVVSASLYSPTVASGSVLSLTEITAAATLRSVVVSEGHEVIPFRVAAGELVRSGIAQAGQSAQLGGVEIADVYSVQHAAGGIYA